MARMTWFAGLFDKDAHGSSVQVKLDLYRGWIALAAGAIGAIAWKKMAS